MDVIYKERLEILKSSYNKRLGAKEQIQNRITNTENIVSTLKRDIITYSSVIDLLQKTAIGARDTARLHLENIVTSALQYISGSDYEFSIELTEKAGKPFAEFYVVVDINGVKSKQKPQDACGGGFVDIISAALRYAYQELYNKPKVMGGNLLDEPGKMVSEQASIKFAEFIKHLGESFDRQTIMITHNDNLKSIADKTINVSLNSNNESVTVEYKDINIDLELDFEV